MTNKLGWMLTTVIGDDHNDNHNDHNEWIFDKDDNDNANQEEEKNQDD